MTKVPAPEYQACKTIDDSQELRGGVLSNEIKHQWNSLGLELGDGEITYWD